MARSMAQRDAQLKAMEAARGAAARRSEEKQRRAEEEANRPPHQHRWNERNVEYVENDGAVFQVSGCCDHYCDEVRVREVRF